MKFNSGWGIPDEREGNFFFDLVIQAVAVLVERAEQRLRQRLCEQYRRSLYRGNRSVGHVAECPRGVEERAGAGEKRRRAQEPLAKTCTTAVVAHP